jgi:hypothetical protein
MLLNIFVCLFSPSQVNLFLTSASKSGTSANKQPKRSVATRVLPYTPKFHTTLRMSWKNTWKHVGIHFTIWLKQKWAATEGWVEGGWAKGGELECTPKELLG